LESWGLDDRTLDCRGLGALVIRTKDDVAIIAGQNSGGPLESRRGGGSDGREPSCQD
jgi:hypothetical protein